jgi:hypothetical protein
MFVGARRGYPAAARRLEAGMTRRQEIRIFAGVAALVALAACSEPSESAASTEAATALAGAPIAAQEVEVTEASFRCIRDMTPVRGFFVDNLLGDLEATVAVAQSPTGGVYPPGSLVQLIPTEAMVKHPPGYNAETNDWEFIELDVTGDGASFMGRGFVDVNNRFGGNCFNCHKRAEAEWDMICEQTHGCDPIPLTPDMFRGIQNTDPRCPTIDLPPEQLEALAALAALSAPPPEE